MSFPALSDDASVLGLAPWRRKIEETARSGRYGPADVGLARWSETAQGFLAQDREVVGKIDAVLHERIELGGRLSARRAQLQAIVSAGAVASPDLALRGKEIEALLRARPTDLTRVVGAMKLFEIEVVALAARAQRG
jgi:hypothetical protein